MFLINDSSFEVAQLKPVWSKKPVGENKRPTISSSRDVYDIMHPVYPDLDMYESFWVMLLSRGNKLKAISNISIGSSTGTVADPKKIFQQGLLANCSSIILIHNHPSGQWKPSGKDIEITNKCKSAGLFLDLPIIDHIIITPEDGYYSFADEGML
jgi:DNA repair protein RadC